ncbi:reverse transcriptase family protein [Glaciimonas sp. CA11.2]|uniref:reverse transcriptase family protein n=1 Tax=Glaciimonas sp. CA11.2 TaxID=3048601 RepID=UPI002AB537AB|nr:reverse transcriptase family protein [Glaciimonas sp. CA11.2]MDY7545501.1 reverse transcriptase family protein [Glaciimonas sp. CA11.2]
MKVAVSDLFLNTSKIHLEYKKYVDESSDRDIQEPFGRLLSLQRQLLKLLSRIETPQFLHSAIKKRSYKTNAEAHLGGQNVFKVDIVKFYCSVKFAHVYNFFLLELECSIDIATILAKICTVETHEHGVHLPTGSCISPILSFLACRNMFDSIDQLCSRFSCVFTLYVDDITVSGHEARPALMLAIASEIAKNGFSSHKYQSYQGTPATITGLIVDNGKIKLPHARAKLIRSFEETLNLTTDVRLKAKLLAGLIGRLSEAEYIDPCYKVKRQNVLIKYKDDWKMITDDRVAKSVLKTAKARKKQLIAKTIDDIVLVPHY